VIRVGVIGARGRMGREVCRVVEAAEDLALVATIDRSELAGGPELDVSASLWELGDDDGRVADGGMQVAVDFTRPDAVLPNARWCLDHGVHVVVGTSGVTPEGLEEIRVLAEAGPANAIVVPNFAVGAVLMMRFAEEAARHFDAVEVIELHHDGKADAPSGTALATARRVGAARAGAWSAPAGDDAHPGARGADVEGIRVHSVRLPGLLAHQEVVFGGPGETLTIRHDSTDRSSFMAGVLLAIRSVGSRPGLTVGLEPLLEG
jgi:4-hydroxy-tetrahydrodipicolinate reductase